MTPKVNYFELIDDYCLNQLDATAKAEFESELKLDANLRNEVKLRKEIQSAISELDVTNLREKLEIVISQSIDSAPRQHTFDLFTDFADFEEIHEELKVVELINFYDSMPKVHVYQHELTSNENTHHFYKEQEVTLMEEEDVNGFSDIEMEDLDGIEEAILEKDIIDFRQTLKQVAKSIEPQFTVREIDSFMNDELQGLELDEFEKELSQNSELRDELMLHEELEKSLTESDIIKLRDQVSQIVTTETSWNVSEQDIEDFINGELDEESLSEFVTELSENHDLMAEIELRRQVNDFIGETDIMDLREGLLAAKESAEDSTVRKLIPSTNRKLYQFIRTGAAVIVVLFGIASLLNSGYFSADKTVNNVFELPQWAPERSVSLDYSVSPGYAFMQKVQAAYIEDDHVKVVNLTKGAQENMQNDVVLGFYSAVSLQILEDYTKAIANYTKVISDGNNMFIEEAEWYRSLCYIKLGNKVKAKQELLAIVNKKGDYRQDAKAVLRRLRFSLE